MSDYTSDDFWTRKTQKDNDRMFDREWSFLTRIEKLEQENVRLKKHIKVLEQQAEKKAP